MVEVVVEFDYDAEEDDELTIRKGNIITNVIKQDGGWWTGELNGKKGVFPDNFVKEIQKDEQKGAKEIKKEGHGSTEIAGKLQNILSKGGGPAFARPGVQKRLNDPSKRQIRAKAAFSYAPENEDELKLEVGDVIEVVRQEEEGWWEGTVNGRKGVFPSNFVEVILEDGTIAKPEDVVLPEGGEQEKVEVQGKKVRGVGLGNIFANGPIVLKKAGSKDEPKKMVRSRQSVVNESPTAEKLPQKSVSPVTIAQKSVSPVTVAGPKKPLTPAVPKEVPNLPPKDLRDQTGFLQWSPDKHGEGEKAFTTWEYPSWCNKSPLLRIQEEMGQKGLDSMDGLSGSLESEDITDRSGRALHIILEEDSECPMTCKSYNESSHYGQGDDICAADRYNRVHEAFLDKPKSKVNSEGDSASDITNDSNYFSQEMRLQYGRFIPPPSEGFSAIDCCQESQYDRNVRRILSDYSASPYMQFQSSSEKIYVPDLGSDQSSNYYSETGESSSISCPEPTLSPQNISYRKRHSRTPIQVNLSVPLLQSTPNSENSIPLKKQRMDGVARLTPVKKRSSKLLTDWLNLSNKENIAPYKITKMKTDDSKKKVMSAALSSTHQDAENIGPAVPVTESILQTPKGSINLITIVSQWSPGEVADTDSQSTEESESCTESNASGTDICHCEQKSPDQLSCYSITSSYETENEDDMDVVDVGAQRCKGSVRESSNESVSCFGRQWLTHFRSTPILKLSRYISNRVSPSKQIHTETQFDGETSEGVDAVDKSKAIEAKDQSWEDKSTHRELEGLTYFDALQKQGRFPRSLRLLSDRYKLLSNKYSCSMYSNSNSSAMQQDVPEKQNKEMSDLKLNEAKMSLLCDEGAKGEGFSTGEDVMHKQAGGSKSARYVAERGKGSKSKLVQFFRYLSSGLLRRTRSAGAVFHQGTEVASPEFPEADPVVIAIEGDSCDEFFDEDTELTPASEHEIETNAQEDGQKTPESKRVCSSDSVVPCWSGDGQSDSIVSNQNTPDVMWHNQYTQTPVREDIERDTRVSHVSMNHSSAENWGLLRSVLGADELHELTASSTTIDTPGSFNTGDSQILGSIESDYDLSDPDVIRAILESEFHSTGLLLSSEDVSEADVEGLLNVSGYACMLGLTAEDSCDYTEVPSDNTTLTDHHNSSNMSNMSEFLLNMSSNAQQYYSLTPVSNTSDLKEDEIYHL